jgi:GT2 family glycosyltransferase
VIDLSIIIVNWNTRELLRRCIASTLDSIAASQLGAEVLVIDNGSSDGSAEMVAEQFPAASGAGVHLIRNSRNLGFAAANNQGMRIARGRYILLLNSDCVVLGTVLADSVEYLQSHATVGAMGCRVLNSDGTLQPTCFVVPTLAHLAGCALGIHQLPGMGWLAANRLRFWQRDSERDVPVITGCYLMVRKQVLQNVGLLDDSFFFYAEETDWCMRMAKAGWALRFAPVGEIIHHGGASSAGLSEQRLIMLAQGLIRLHLKHFGVVSAAFAWCWLALGHLLRTIAFRTMAAISKVVFRRGSTAADWLTRARLHGRVLRLFANAWPKNAPAQMELWPAAAPQN